MIEFSIPGFYHQKDVNNILFDLLDEHRNMFYDDIIINSSYDSFPCIWNGGRYIPMEDIKEETIKNIINKYNNRGISIRHTFTNKYINETNINDYIGNCILNISNDGSIKNGVNTNNNYFRDYIKQNYNNLYVIYSTTGRIKDIDMINNISKDELIIPDYSINNKFEIIEHLEHPENIEFVTAEHCVENCPYRSLHYDIVSKQQMGLSYKNVISCCPDQKDIKDITKVFNYYTIVTKRKHFIGIDDIRNKYLPLGFNKFKLSGRTDNPISLIEKYVDFFVKPEYRDTIRFYFNFRYIYITVLCK